MIKVVVEHHGWKKYPVNAEVKFDDNMLEELQLAEKNKMIKIIKMPDMIEFESSDKLDRRIKNIEFIEFNEPINSEDFNG